MAVNDAFFGPPALAKARGAQGDSDGWPEYNGGILMPKRWPVPAGQYIYRFASATVPHDRRVGGEWWLEYAVLRSIARLIRENGLARRDAVRYCLALPWSWTPVDRLLRAQVIKPLDAYRGLGKSALGAHTRDAGGIYIPPQHLREL